MIIIRYEDQWGKGPYSWSSGEWQTKPHTGANGNPPPYPNEFSDYDRSWQDKLFGFNSLKAMHKWFPAKERQNLHKCGFRVAVYDVPPEDVSVSTSGKQVTFPHNSILISKGIQ